MFVTPAIGARMTGELKSMPPIVRAGATAVIVPPILPVHYASRPIVGFTPVRGYGVVAKHLLFDGLRPNPGSGAYVTIWWEMLYTRTKRFEGAS